MPPRPLFGTAMTAAERQRRRRLRLRGGAAAVFEQHVRQALDAGLTPAELARLLARVSGGAEVPPTPASAADEAPTRDTLVPKPPKPPPSVQPPPKRDLPVTRPVEPPPATTRDRDVTRREQLLAIGTRWVTEFDVRVDYSKRNRRAYVYSKKRTIYMVGPPTTVKRLSSLAHEIGHVALRHRSGLPRYVEEFEAELFRFALLARDGVSDHDLPLELLKARWYVGQKIRQGQGLKWVDPWIAAWANLGLFLDDLGGDAFVRYRPSALANAVAITRALARNESVTDPSRVDHYGNALGRLSALGLTVPSEVLVPA